MEYRNLGQSGLKVSSLCLGAMTFGEPNERSFMHKVAADEETSFALIDRALELGVNFIDTAYVYGQDGLAERVLGKWLGRSKKRNSVILATKFRFRMGEGANDVGASRYHIMRAVEESLTRLGTDRIELYQIHMQDRETPEEETLRALDDLVRQGKVLYIGASNYAAYRLVESLMTSRSEGLHRYVSLQAQYSLAVRNIERELVPTCLRFGLGILPWSPLASGFLSGKYHRGQSAPTGSRLEHWRDTFGRLDNDRNWNLLDVVRKVAGELKATPPQVALAWLMTRPAVTSVIFGARTVAQLEENVQAADLKLTPGQLESLEAASAIDLGYPYDFIKRIQGGW